ncbi:MAG TPA: precorrin-6y C5,15-methyltransferase (decarboxylating) subunit CbiE [Mycobacteriales bacterium]|jgi:precorrin-6Y C5,15-methyltransferase (decarboxylating)|nr:precorrin-6y C5,15-methyltransferase (decarboxylating) subunit CbiE [Mycobacteriales bacterium]
MSITVKPRITVLGVDGREMTDHARERLAGAALVVGGERHLTEHADAIPPGALRSALGGDLTPVLDAVVGATGPVVVLASGDPAFFGIVRALAERVGRKRLDVVPAVSSVATVFARAALSWDDAVVVSAHGRDLRRAVNTALARPKVAILTAPGSGPAEIAAALADAPRTMIVGERLGTPQERVVEGAPPVIAAQQWAEPNVVIVLDETRALPPRGAVFPRAAAPAGWALDEHQFDHRDGMVTKAEVRALALARLGPGLGDLVWDIGAGSGSVGVECARFGAAVIAIDRDVSTAERIRANADRHGVDVRIVAGNAAALLGDLPDPDAVFVGGSGDEFEPVLAEAAKRAARAVVVALAGIERVTHARETLAAAGFAVEVVLLQASRLRDIGALSGFAAANPVFVVSGVRR